MTTVKEVIPRETKQRKNRWNSQSNERQQIIPRNSAEYMMLNIANKCKQTKDEWLNEECAECRHA